MRKLILSIAISCSLLSSGVVMAQDNTDKKAKTETTCDRKAACKDKKADGTCPKVCKDKPADCKEKKGDKKSCCASTDKK